MLGLPRSDGSPLSEPLRRGLGTETTPSPGPALWLTVEGVAAGVARSPSLAQSAPAGRPNPPVGPAGTLLRRCAQLLDRPPSEPSTPCGCSPACPGGTTSWAGCGRSARTPGGGGSSSRG